MQRRRFAARQKQEFTLPHQVKPPVRTGEGREPAVPLQGDVLVSNPTATIEHEIGIVPEKPHIFCPTHDTAVAKARELAETLQVDAWLTEDHTHFMRIASCRSAMAR